MKLLRIDSSARRRSVSRQLTSRFVEEWKKQNPQGQVIERDLAATELPHITDDFPANSADLASVTPEQEIYLATSDKLVDELLSADIIVIGAPMYNFTVSWELKAWIDQIVRLGRTVSYGPNGAQGLVTGKRAVIISSCGSAYAPGTLRAQADFQGPYLRHVLRFIGVTDVQVLRAENQFRKDQAEAARLAVFEQITGAVSSSVSA